MSILLVNTAVLLGTGPAVTTLSARSLMLKMSLALLHALEAIAQRATVLWDVLPASVTAFFEKIALLVSHFASLLAHRVMGWLTQALVAQARAGVPLDPPTPLPSGPLLDNPALWLGLVAAAVVLAAAARRPR